MDTFNDNLMKIQKEKPEQTITQTKKKLISDDIVPSDFIAKSGEMYKWIWLPSAEIGQLLIMRNAEHVISSMRNTEPITEEMHCKFLKEYETLQRIDFILVSKKSGQYVGGMNISLTHHGFEIGKYIGNPTYLGSGIACPMAISFIEYVKENIKEITRIRAVTRIENYKNINLNFKLGFKIVKLVEEKYWLMELK